MNRLHVWLTVYLCALQGIALARKGPPQSAASGHLRWRSCEFETDPFTTDGPAPWPVLCLRPEVGSGVLLRNVTSAESATSLRAHTYAGVHVSSWLSVHGEWTAQRYYRMNPNDEDAAVWAIRETDYTFVRLGNPAYYRWGLDTGRLPNTFGVNHLVTTDMVQSLMKTTAFWDAPRYGAKLSFDNQISSLYEVAYLNNAPFQDKESKNARASDEAVSIRMSFDIGALEGFRSTISGYGSNRNERRVGLGFINRNGRGDVTAVEWVRSSKHVSISEPEFDQVFRINFAAAFRSTNRFVAEYEDVRKTYQIFSIGNDTALPDYGLLRPSIGYYWSRGSALQSGWILAVSVGLRL